MQDDYQIQIMPVAICLIIFGVHTNNLFNIKVKKSLGLIKWSYSGLIMLTIEPRMVSIS
jgi:hypothetical protein